jgi:ergothioneine biosynthesis protein EgtB
MGVRFLQPAAGARPIAGRGVFGTVGWEHRVNERIDDLSAVGRAPAETTAADLDLGTRFRAVRRFTEELSAPLSAEDCQAQSMPDASPAKWHLAHTTWFFETFVLERAVAGYRPFHPEFRVLFNSYYQTVGPQHPRPERGLLTRPALDEVLAYRRHVDTEVCDLLGAGIGNDLDAIVRLGLEHEQQHQELLLTDVKHLLSVNPLRPAYLPLPPAPADGAAPALSWRAHAEHVDWIGHDGGGFSFDNERPRHRVLVPAFELASRPVTAGEFVAFIEDGGYERPELWLSDGWSVVQSHGWKAPLYWECRDGVRLEFTLGGLRQLAATAPVCHVSLYEADAFARWAGARLPTEAEWEVAARDMPVAGNFAESGLLHPAAAWPRSEDGPARLFGDVWEWTQSAYAPYPGYKPPAGALGEYNGKFMCNQMVLRGGSCATPASHMRATYRNFFYPHARWQFSGIRLARDLA